MKYIKALIWTLGLFAFGTICWMLQVPLWIYYPIALPVGAIVGIKVADEIIHG